MMNFLKFIDLHFKLIFNESSNFNFRPNPYCEPRTDLETQLSEEEVVRGELPALLAPLAAAGVQNRATCHVFL